MELSVSVGGFELSDLTLSGHESTDDWHGKGGKASA